MKLSEEWDLIMREGHVKKFPPWIISLVRSNFYRGAGAALHEIQTSTTTDQRIKRTRALQKELLAFATEERFLSGGIRES